MRGPFKDVKACLVLDFVGAKYGSPFLPSDFFSDLLDMKDPSDRFLAWQINATVGSRAEGYKAKKMEEDPRWRLANKPKPRTKEQFDKAKIAMRALWDRMESRLSKAGANGS